jgi:dTMP kinase
MSLFITLEGGEGSGKTTQIKMLQSVLADMGYETVITREPGGTPEAEKIRDLLVQRDGGDWDAEAECLLLFAARHMHYKTLIKPSLEQKRIVISDRFTDSTRAYQGHGMGMDLSEIEKIKQTAIGNVEPDITFILDIPVTDGLARSLSRLSQEEQGAQTEDRYESRKIEFHEKLRQGYLLIANDHPERCVIIDACQSVDDIHAQMLEVVSERLEDS